MASSALPPPHLEPSAGFLQNVLVSHCRENQEFCNLSPGLWKSMSGMQAISVLSYSLQRSLRQLQSVTNAADTFPHCAHYISTKPL